MTTQTPPKSDVRSYVRQHYGQIAESFTAEAPASCCSSSTSCCPQPNGNAALIYDIPEMKDLPEEVTGLSLGCGDPVTLAALQPGQVVLDLGSGGGIDCFLAAKKVGPTGHVIGVDMTPAMLEKARASQRRMKMDNVEFRLGEIEHLPVADNSVDVILSNCVINLSPDKPQVFREAYRVLKPGGQLAVSDIVTDGPLPEAVRNSLNEWAGCVAGALDVKEYLAGLHAAGFTQVELTPVYLPQEMMAEALNQAELDGGEDVPAEHFSKAVFSAKIKARK